MIEFLSSHYKELIVIVICLIELILFIVKKRPSLNLEDKVDALISDILPQYINLAEVSGLKGHEKLVFVVSNVISRLKHFISGLDEIYWAKVITDKVEAILTTPQKKEVNYEKK